MLHEHTLHRLIDFKENERALYYVYCRNDHDFDELIQSLQTKSMYVLTSGSILCDKLTSLAKASLTTMLSISLASEHIIT